ncbi:MAG: hypothetical protein KAG06_08550, partial [Methylococcales bacterium]|nr:hypothetical protein [Methylococcales bacterium]
GLEGLNTEIDECLATKVPLIRAKLPNKWLKVKTQLETLAQNDNFIEYSEFRRLCEQQNVNDESTQNVLAKYLNDLGVIIHFDDDSQLIGTPVLKPHWITQAVYKVICYKSVAEAHGLFYLNDLAKVLEQKTESDFYYPPEKRPHIIDLMKKFEICYALGEKRILIPDLLGVQEPDFEFDYDNNKAVRFRFRYDFLSKLIMPRFIVKQHEKIENKNLRWRTGVVLKDENYGVRALIKVDYEEKFINIVVIGEQKRDFFTIIRNTFREIHEGFAKETFKFTEWVLLPDNPQHNGIEYAELIGYEKAGRDEYYIGKLDKSYSVSKLLNGIEKPEVRRKEGDKNHFNIGVVQMNKEDNSVHAAANSQVQSFNQSDNNNAHQNKNKPSESKEGRLFKKPSFYIGLLVFIYFCLVVITSYDLQKQGLLGNKTFQQIVLSPIALLTTDAE